MDQLSGGMPYASAHAHCEWLCLARFHDGEQFLSITEIKTVPCVLRLCSVLERRKGTGRKQAILYRQSEMTETQCSLFPIYGRSSKLLVAGSIPVSRSTLSN
jgi:hypothetical protein